MNSFEGGQIKRPVSQEILRSVRMLGEYKGRQALYVQQTPQVLSALRQAAVVQSTESSNRIEGVVASFTRIQEIVAQKTTPVGRSEQEIAGYRDVLQTIHSSYEYIPISTNIVLQLHGDLYRYTPVIGGKWKSADNEIVERGPDGRRIVRFHSVNEIVERGPDGRRIVRFHSVAAWSTPMAMDELHRSFNEEWLAEETEPLLLISAYVLDFLCIHPFLDGNGRMARLLTLLLLYKAGYEVGRYISLEKFVEDSKESYYEALGLSSQRWHEGLHDLEPWANYLLGTMLAAYKGFEARVGTLSSVRGAKTEMVIDAFERLPMEFRLVDLERACPSTTRDMIRVVLNNLKNEGRVEAVGRGLAARWIKRPVP